MKLNMKQVKLDIKFDALPITINDEALQAVPHGRVLAIVLATKPCFYKLWSVMVQAEKARVPYIILNTGQHYDELLGHGINEFNFNDKIAVDLGIRGELATKSAEIFLKTQELYSYIITKYPKMELIPYVNGDTLVAGVLPAAWMFSANQKALQGEAGLRSMIPEGFKNLNEFNGDCEKIVDTQFFGKWEIMRNEPFPEQWDTYVSAAASQYFFAPVNLNKEHLAREGYPNDDIHVTGNTVVDALKLKRKEKPEKSIFEIYPQLEKSEWLRVDIHRRENLTEKRFKSIIGSITNLVENKKNVLFVELTATKKALEFYNLREKLVNLERENKNFLFTPLWKEYGHVVEFLDSDNCWAILTDSGSMQEEMNEIGKPCLTCRFSTDRPETVFDAKSNLLVPPIKSELISDLTDFAFEKREIFNNKKLYGKDVGKNIISRVKNIFDKNEPMFKWVHEELSLSKENGNNLRYL